MLEEYAKSMLQMVEDAKKTKEKVMEIDDVKQTIEIAKEEYKQLNKQVAKDLSDLEDEFIDFEKKLDVLNIGVLKNKAKGEKDIERVVAKIEKSKEYVDIGMAKIVDKIAKIEGKIKDDGEANKERVRKIVEGMVESMSNKILEIRESIKKIDVEAVAKKVEELEERFKNFNPQVYVQGLGSGVTKFTQLGDAPTSYEGQAGKVVKVNATEDGLEFGTGGGGAVDSVNGQTGVVVLDTGDIAEATDKNYMTDAEQTKLGYISVTQAVDLDQMETDIAALANGMIYKGNWDASAGTFPGAGAAEIGWFYTVSVGGTVDSVVFNIGDRLIAIADNASTTTYAGNWNQLDATDAVTSVNGQTGNVTVGDVTKVGTPVNNQVGIWTGDGTIEGDSNFTWDGGFLNLTGAIDVYDASGTQSAYLGVAYNYVELSRFDTGTSNGGGMRVSTGMELFGKTIIFDSADGTYSFNKSTTIDGIFDFNSLSVDRTFTFPDTTGTVALTSDLSSCVVGPASATDNALVRYDGTTGKLVQNSGATLADDVTLALSGANANIVVNTDSTTTQGLKIATSKFGIESNFDVAGGYAAYFHSDGTATASPSNGVVRIRQATSGASGAALIIDNLGTSLSVNVQQSGTTVFAVNPSGSIELGHASDTTMSRVSAGVVAIEGDNIVTETATQTLTNKTINISSNTVTVDGTNEVGFKNIPQNSQSDAYTLLLGDAGKHIYHPSADTTARTWTIPANASVAYPIGTAITFVNDTSAGVITIAITSDTLVLAGTGTTGSRTLAANGVATAIKVTSTRWIINGTGLT